MNVFEIFAKLGIDTSEYDKGLDGASGKATSFAGKIGGGLVTAAKVGMAAVGAASTAVTAFGATSVKTGMSFDSSISQVAATMGLSMAEMETQVGTAETAFGSFEGTLREFAQFMGANTAFSASEAADALNYMALAGYDAQTSMNMLPNVLNLAAAGSIDLAYASDMVTDASSALGLSLDETSSLVDKMAMASSKSNTSVAQLGEAILTVGGTAKNLAKGTTELSTALGILADNGVKGAEGGTALRNIILSLSAPTDKAAKEMAELGLEVFDAEGNMRPLNDTFNDLNEILSTMSQQDQTGVLNDLFNKVDLKSVNALLANTGERFDELSGYIDEATGSAQKMADTQLDNLAGDVTKFKSALEGAQIAVSDGLTPSLREFVQFGTDGVSKLTTAFQEGGLTGAMDALGDVIGDGISMLIENAPKVIDAAITLLEAFGKGIMDNLPQLLDATVEIVMMLVNGIVDNLPALVEAALQIILQLAEGLTGALPELVPAIVDVIIQIVETLLDNVDLLIDAAGKLIIGLAKGIVNAIPHLVEQAPVILVKLVAALLQGVGQLIEVGVELVAGIIIGIGKAAASLWQAAKNLVNELIAQFKSLLGIHSPSTVFAEFGKMIIQGLINGILSLVATAVSTITNVGGRIKNAFSSIISNAKSWGKDMMDNFIGGIKDKIESVKSAASSVASTVKKVIGFSEPDEGPLSDFHTYAPDMMALFAKGIKDNESLITDQLSDSFDFGNLGTYSASTMTGNMSTGTSREDIYTAVKMAFAEVLQEVGIRIDVEADKDGLFKSIVSSNNEYKKRHGGIGALA